MAVLRAENWASLSPQFSVPSFLYPPQRQLANYNFDFRSWPVDFHWEEPSSR